MTATHEEATPEVCTWVRAFTPFLPEIQNEPFTRFAEMRTHCPVARSDAIGGFWILSRYEDVRFALQHHELFSNDVNTIPPHSMTGFGPDIPTQLDPPEHTRYRTILNRALALSVVDRFEDRIRERARRLLEPITTRSSWDFIAEFAVPFPTEVFCELMGLPESQLATFLEWKDAVIRPSGGEESLKKQNVLGELIEYFTSVYRARRLAGEPGDDLMGVLLAATPDGDAPISEGEFVRMASFLWAAGLDTVTAQLGFAFLHLGRHPEHRDALVADPGLIPMAMEELMRFDTLVNDCRRVREDVEVGGQLLRAGDNVLLLYSAASRDPDQFPEPDRVDFSRRPNRHLGFGAGVHRCAGSHLARAQMRIAFEEIHRLLPTYRIDESVPTACHLGWIRGVDVLRLALDPAER